MANTTFNTRIQNKIDTYENYEKVKTSFIPLKGEVCIATVSTQVGGVQSPPQTLIKIGDGKSTWENLKWLSATAADVIDSLKGSNPTLPATSITGLNDYISGQIQDTNTQYRLVASGTMGIQLQSKEKGEEDTAFKNVGAPITLTPPTYSLIPGDTNGTVKFGVVGEESEVAVTGLKSGAYVDIASLALAEVSCGAKEVIGTIKQENGIVIATKKTLTEADIPFIPTSKVTNLDTTLAGKQDTLTFNTPYDAASNKAATMTDVNNAKSEANSYTDGQVSAAKTELIGSGSGSSTTIKGVYDEAKTYTDQQVAAQIGSAYKAAGSVNFASLPELAASEEGKVYNITNEFTTNENFIEGAGNEYPAGTNVVCVDSDDAGTYKWDVLSGVVDLSLYDTSTVAQGKIDAAKQAAIEAAAADATQKANTAEQNAKSYANGLKTTIDGSIALKADKTTVDELTEQVETVESTLADKADSSTVTALEGKVTAAEGEIDTLQTQIASKADKTEVATVNTRIDNLDNNDAEVDGQFLVSAVQTDGLVAVARKKVNIAKLEQTSGEYIIFNCGNASTNV